MFLCFITFLYFFLARLAVADFDPGVQTNLVLYWGQNSVNDVDSQNRLSHYCQESNVDVILISFLVSINGTNGQPRLNFANQQGKCEPQDQPLICPEIEADIETCQGKGKRVLLSIGGANTDERGFATETAAAEAAEKIWLMFGPDQGNPDIKRPFGKASVDGFDFDFEKNVTNAVAFAKELRERLDLKTTSGGKPFLMTAAPQCPFSGLEWQVEFLENLRLDTVFVQFYNNPSCTVNWDLNFKAWNDWAEKKNTTFFVGLPAHTGATTNGYVTPNQLNGLFAKAKLMPKMRGAMLWDASQAWKNELYHNKVKAALNATGSASKRRSRSLLKRISWDA